MEQDKVKWENFNKRLNEGLLRLRELAQNQIDPEHNHSEADCILLEIIGDDSVTSAYDNIKKWYA